MEGRRRSASFGKDVEKGFHPLSGAGRVGLVGGGKIEHPLAQNRPHAALQDGPHRRLLKKIAVTKGGDPVFQHLHAGEQRSPVNHLGVHLSRLRREDDFMKPAGKGQVIAESPKTAHGGMGVGVDQAGEHEEAGEVHFVAAAKSGLDLIRRADGNQFGAVDGEGSRTEAAHRLVAGHQPRDVGEQQVHLAAAGFPSDAETGVPPLGVDRSGESRTRSITSSTSMVRSLRSSITRRPWMMLWRTSEPRAA